jgi:hypothetical protein
LHGRTPLVPRATCAAQRKSGEMLFSNFISCTDLLLVLPCCVRASSTLVETKTRALAASSTDNTCMPLRALAGHYGKRASFSFYPDHCARVEMVCTARYPCALLPSALLERLCVLTTDMYDPNTQVLPLNAINTIVTHATFPEQKQFTRCVDLLIARYVEWSSHKHFKKSMLDWIGDANNCPPSNLTLAQKLGAHVRAILELHHKAQSINSWTPCRISRDE